MSKGDEAIIQIRTTAGVKEQLLRGAALRGGGRATLSAYLIELGLADSSAAEARNAKLATRFGVSDPLLGEDVFVSLIETARAKKASDVFLQATSNGDARISFRIVGEIHEEGVIEAQNFAKTMAGIEDRLELARGVMETSPDGDFTEGHLVLGKVTLRLCRLKTSLGTNVVIRIMAKDDRHAVPAEICELIERRVQGGGLVAVTGAIGSGKSNTCYGAIEFIGKHKRLVYTVEDHVEYTLDQVEQVHVDQGNQAKAIGQITSVISRNGTIIFVGALRDRDTMAAVDRAVYAGMGVICTILATTKKVGESRVLDVMNSLGATTKPNLIVEPALVRLLCEDCSKNTRSATAIEVKAIQALMQINGSTLKPPKQLEVAHKRKGCTCEGERKALYSAMELDRGDYVTTLRHVDQGLQLLISHEISLGSMLTL